MSIYITEQKKKELEAKIAELECEKLKHEIQSSFDLVWVSKTTQTIDLLKEFLLEAIVLPVEESWEDCLSNTERDDCVNSCKNNYPNGVIIKK